MGRHLLLPLSVGFLIAGPVSGYLSDRLGARAFSSAGLLVFGASFVGLMLLPVDFAYWAFALLIAANGVGSGMFAAPNTSAIMSSVPAHQRGVASGMRSTFQFSGNLLSIGVSFSLMIVGLARNLPSALSHGLQQQGVPETVARQIAALPPVSSLFAAFLGVNPLRYLLAPSGTLAALPVSNQRVITGTTFFPSLIAQPFHDGLVVVFSLAAALAVFAAAASFSRGGRFLHSPVAGRTTHVEATH